jgi:hypothetical protein
MTTPINVASGRARGWKVIDGATLDADRTLEADAVIVGSGAGITRIASAIYGLTARLASGLAPALTGKPAARVVA